MNSKFFLLIFLMFSMSACHFENKVVEEKYPNGSPKRVCTYLGNGENRQMIKEITYYPNKQAQMEGGYKEKKRDGKWTYWYQNGKVWSEGLFVKGKSDGKRTTYYESGKVRYEGFYKEDLRVGKWRFFDENGRLLQEVDYSAPPKSTIPTTP